MENKFDTVICLRIGKTNKAKTPSGDFKVTTPEISLLSQQAVTSKGIPVPYTILQLNPYPNTQLDLFCSVNLSFWCTASNTWLTNCANPSTRFQSPTREGCWLQSFSRVHHSCEEVVVYVHHRVLWPSIFLIFIVDELKNFATNNLL